MQSTKLTNQLCTELMEQKILTTNLLIWVSNTTDEICFKPEIIVDREFWYKWALKRLGLNYRHETFGTRNAVEGFFSILKGRTKTFFNRFPFYSSFESVQNWLESFVMLHNVEMLLG